MATERLAPDVLIVQDNLSGVVGDIQDDPDSPDGNWLTAISNNADSICRVSFSTPTGNPTVGTDLQEFRALVRKIGGTGTPEARLELWENGVLIREGVLEDITTDTVINFTWNANELGTSDGSLVECRVYGKKSGGGPSARAAIEVGAVEWNVVYDVGGIVFLDGTSGAISSVSGDIKRTRKIDATVSALSSLSADLKATRKIDGAIGVVSSVLADLILAYNLKGTSVAQSALSGKLTIVGEPGGVCQGMRGNGYFLNL